MSRIAVLLILLSGMATTGCAHCYDWALKPKLDTGEYETSVRVVPLNRAECKRRDKEREKLSEAHVCTQLEKRWNLDICWDNEDWDDYERNEDDARTGELPND